MVEAIFNIFLKLFFSIKKIGIVESKILLNNLYLFNL